ncbi:hypothetical protein O6H91_20G018000 [Diphasiastrum complanatum]|uniref:Uncharacterized protein n=1 Tax=Diphasiastrum complanatum TaxID=34168 RepID=A0ACC2AN16_DIPCM|nr:hypothetical protein O6H91_20G018000 [Diphasiastrum complanatum]
MSSLLSFTCSPHVMKFKSGLLALARSLSFGNTRISNLVWSSCIPCSLSLNSETSVSHCNHWVQTASLFFHELIVYNEICLCCSMMTFFHHFPMISFSPLSPFKEI